MAALSYPQFLASKRFPDFDGLRAIAVLAVVWHHTHPGGSSSILAKSGFHGVTLFFALSGYLITSLLVRERLKYGRIDLRAFYVRRSLRIFPLYFGTLLLYSILVATMERGTPAGAEFWHNLKYFATYTSNLFVPLEGDRVIFYFAWSLATEEQFYLIWPPLLLILGSSLTSTWAMLAALAVSIGGAALGIRFFSAMPFAILAGSLMSLLLHDQRSYLRIVNWLGTPWSPVAALGAGLLCIAVPTAPQSLIHIASALLVSSCSIQNWHVLSKLLNAQVMVYLGGISYGLYMLHMLGKNLVSKLLIHTGAPVQTELLVFPLTLLLATLLATVSYRMFESRFLAIKVGYER